MKIIKRVVIVFLLLLLNEYAIANEDVSSVSEQHHVGTVLQSMTEGKYTYLELDVDGKNLWIATLPEFLTVTLGKGDKVEYIGGVLMQNFTSKSLGKTFESILFITRIKVLMKNSVMVPTDDYHNTSVGIEAKFIPVREGEIKKPQGSKTIVEIFSERDQLKDTVVTLEAKVVKVSERILKRNWITLSDGTGTPPDDSIIFTTTGMANINDIVTVKGIVRTDVNLGGDYKYKVLLEDTHDVNEEKGNL